MSGFPLSDRVSPTTFWMSRRDSTSYNTGLGIVVFRCYRICIFLGLSGRVCSVVDTSVVVKGGWSPP